MYFLPVGPRTELAIHGASVSVTRPAFLKQRALQPSCPRSAEMRFFHDSNSNSNSDARFAVRKFHFFPPSFPPSLPSSLPQTHSNLEPGRYSTCDVPHASCSDCPRRNFECKWSMPPMASLCNHSEGRPRRRSSSFG